MNKVEVEVEVEVCCPYPFIHLGEERQGRVKFLL